MSAPTSMMCESEQTACASSTTRKARWPTTTTEVGSVVRPSLPHRQHSYWPKAFPCNARSMSAPMSARTSTLARMSRMAIRPWVSVGFQVGAAAVGTQPVQGDHVHRDDHQRPERVGRDEEHLV